jgi:hypothetical protein
MKNGIIDITKLKVGETDIQKVYAGNDLIWPSIPDLDPDAELFLTASNITDQTQTEAINDLVVGLKNADIWDKMIAIYPFVGGTEETHKYNLKDPRDLDEAYRLVYSGNITHSLTGVKSDRTDPLVADNDFLNTNLPINWTNFNTDIHLSSYGSETESQGFVMGRRVGTGTGARDFHLAPRNNLTESSVFFFGVPHSSNGFYTNQGLNTTSLGFFHGSRIGNIVRFYRNEEQIFINNNFTLTALASTIPIYILNCNVNNISTVFGTRTTISYVGIGLGLTDQQEIDLNTIITSYQTKLNRNV